MNILIVGSGGHAGVAIHTIEAQAHYHIVGLVDDFAEPGKLCYGHMVHGGCDQLAHFIEKHDARACFIAVGDNKARRLVWNKIRSIGVMWPHIIHPTAYVFPSVQIEAGTIICAGAVVGPGSRVGRFSIVNTNASLDHDSELGEFSHLAPNSATGGCVQIGSGTLIGIGASIRDRITVGDNCVIGMGSCVVDSIDSGKAWGNPAKAK